MFRFHLMRGLSALLFALPLLAHAAAPATLFAAASLKPALDAMAAQGVLGRPMPRLVYAASSALARQIDQGAPADIYISADEAWMDDVGKRGHIVKGSRRDLLSNALVLVAPAAAPAPQVDLHRISSIERALGEGGRLAIALPDSVPAGRYARQSLTRLGLWPALSSRLAPARDVRAALALVVHGQCPLGAVYRSDAVSERAVRVIAEFPADSHVPILYPMAIVQGHDKPASRALLQRLGSEKAAAIFRKFGFAPHPAP